MAQFQSISRHSWSIQQQFQYTNYLRMDHWFRSRISLTSLGASAAWGSSSWSAADFSAAWKVGVVKVGSPVAKSQSHRFLEECHFPKLGGMVMPWFGCCFHQRQSNANLSNFQMLGWKVTAQSGLQLLEIFKKVLSCEKQFRQDYVPANSKSQALWTFFWLALGKQTW